jgi:hypothetical protein
MKMMFPIKLLGNSHLELYEEAENQVIMLEIKK